MPSAVRVELVVQMKLPVEVVGFNPSRQAREEHPASGVGGVGLGAGDVADFGTPFVEGPTTLSGHAVGHGHGAGVGGAARIQVDVLAGQDAAQLGNKLAVAFARKKMMKQRKLR